MEVSSESRPPAALPWGNIPRNSVDASEKRSLAPIEIRTLDRPARSPVIVFQLSLLLRAYLSTETKKQVATIKLFWAYAGVNRGKAPRIHDCGTRWWWGISFALRPQCRGKVSHCWSSDRRLREPEHCCVCLHGTADHAASYFAPRSDMPELFKRHTVLMFRILPVFCPTVPLPVRLETLLVTRATTHLGPKLFPLLKLPQPSRSIMHTTLRSGYAVIEWRVFYFCHAWQKGLKCVCSIPPFSSSVRWGIRGLRLSAFRHSFVSKATGKFFFFWGGGRGGIGNDYRKMSTDGRNVNVFRVIPQFVRMYLATLSACSTLCFTWDR